jgi:hypothetical protein
MPARDLNVTWQPISLLFKNDPEDPERRAAPQFTHNLMRVLESVRETEGEEAVQTLYWEYGRRIHHDRNRDFTAAEALAAAGLPESHAAAFDDEARDAEIRKRMDVGLELAGDNVGTPIIAVDNEAGDRVALFGPVITRVPNTELSLRLWDGFVLMATVPGFWELKRTRTERPEFGERP